MGWRKTVRAVHREVGFFCLGLTLVYALSGFLLNHLHQWNTFYRVERESAAVAPRSSSAPLPQGEVASILVELGEAKAPLGSFQPDQETLQIFFEERMITVRLSTGEVEGEVVKRRPILAAVNTLHLNNAGKGWTWLADLYAFALALLALTSLFMVRGPKGPAGRGGLLALAGLLLPLLWALFFL